MPYAVDVALWLLVAGSVITVVQRLVAVRQSAAGSRRRPRPGGRRMTAVGAAAAGRGVRGGLGPGARRCRSRSRAPSFRSGADLAFRRDGAGVRAAARATTRASCRRPGPRSWTSWSARASGPTRGTGWRRSGCRAWTTRRSTASVRRAGRRPKHWSTPRLDRGKGAVLVLPHTGNFDVSGIWLVGHAGRFTTVNERLKPESLYRRFVGYRESLGLRDPAAPAASAYRGAAGTPARQQDRLPARRPRPVEAAACR